MTLTNKELREALDLLDEGYSRLMDSGYRDIKEHADVIGAAIDELWTIHHEAENAPVRCPDPLTRAMFGTGEE